MANNVYTVVSIEASKELIKNFVDKLFTPEVEEADWQKKSDLLADNLYGLLYKDYPKDNLTRDWMTECRVNQPSFKATRRRAAEHKLEEVGSKLRAMMPWIAEQKLVDKDKN